MNSLLLNKVQMKLHIDHTLTIDSLQKEFNAEFPYLKLEFFSEAHTKGKPTAGKHMHSQNLTLAEVGLDSISKFIDIPGDMPVHKLEETLKDNFGMNVQVFRKSGKIWLETTATDDWTLSYQNEQGKELSEGPAVS